MDHHSDKAVIWQVVIHVTFVASAVFLVWIERMTTPAHSVRARNDVAEVPPV